MSFVFISHRSLDKPKIKPIVEALITAGIKVWVDKPGGGDGMGFTDAEVARHFSGYLGAGHYRSGDRGLWVNLRAASAVLVCWSEHAATIGEDWEDEARFGQIAGKLVCCRIDDVAISVLKDRYKVEQVFDMRPTPQGLSDEGRIIDELRRIMAGQLALKETFKPLPAILPWLIDCASQSDTLRCCVSEFLIGQELKKHTARRPVFVLCSVQKDGAEPMIRRFAQHELREMCHGTELKPDLRLKQVDWPTAGQIEVGLATAINRAIDAPGGYQEGQPRIAYTLVNDTRTVTAAGVSAWLKAWDGALTRVPKCPFIPTLWLVDSPSFWGRKSKKLGAIVGAFEGQTLRGEVIGPPQELREDEANTWVDECIPYEIKMKRADLELQAKAFIEEKFRESWKPKLGEFAHVVARTPWFLELIEIYKQEHEKP